MATKTLRPARDTSVSHSRSSGSNAYSLLNEVTSDGDSTYIYQTVSSTSSSTVSTTVGLDTIFDSTHYVVSACRLYFVARRSASNTSSVNVVFKVGNNNYTVSASSLTNSYTTYNATNTSMVSAINQALSAGNVPDITATISTTGAMSSSKDSSSNIRVTQVYLEVDYESTDAPAYALFLKENGTWKAYTTAYRKVNGVWVEQNIATLFDTNTNYVKMN